MKAVVQHRYGGVEQLEITDVETPEPAAGEVLVRVRAAGIERGTVHLMTGLPLVGRAALGLRRPRSATPGRELAGVVVAVGEGVTRFGVGDEVMGAPSPVLKSGPGHGALAELTRPSRPCWCTSRPRSPSSRPPRCRSRGPPPSRRSATMAASRPGSGCW